MFQNRISLIGFTRNGRASPHHQEQSHLRGALCRDQAAPGSTSSRASVSRGPNGIASLPGASSAIPPRTWRRARNVQIHGELRSRTYTGKDSIRAASLRFTSGRSVSWIGPSGPLARR